MKYLTSTNLITDLAFKSKVGVKAEASVEALAVINSAKDEIRDLKIDKETRADLKITAKLFLRKFDVDLAVEAVHHFKDALGKSP